MVTELLPLKLTVTHLFGGCKVKYNSNYKTEMNEASSRYRYKQANALTSAVRDY